MCVSVVCDCVTLGRRGTHTHAHKHTHAHEHKNECTVAHWSQKRASDPPEPDKSAGIQKKKKNLGSSERASGELNYIFPATTSHFYLIVLFCFKCRGIWVRLWKIGFLHAQQGLCSLLSYISSSIVRDISRYRHPPRGKWVLSNNPSTLHSQPSPLFLTGENL